MVLWPVRAALQAGAGRVVVVDSPDRALQPVLPEEVELAVQPRPDCTGGGGAAALAHLRAGAAGASPEGAPLVVLSGDVPLGSAYATRELAHAHERAGSAYRC